ncbi:MAG TPA: cation-translocating P-type ATPase, partial [Gaiellaceae bacterium]|nr:cation-translocating P-type ATPase [Gaiellaceae bacterium]
MSVVRERTTLALEGMTCASCAARIERTLNRLDGVEATVNYATETATVDYDAARVLPERLVEAVEGIGYRASTERAREPESGGAPWQLLLAVACSVPLLLLGMVPPLRFAGWEWVSFALAAPVVFWSGLGFHRAALLNARHGAATMDTLVSVGTLAAFVGRYFETAAVITALILLGRFLEDRARRRSGAAVRALLELGAAEAQDLAVGDLFTVRPGERIATDGVVVEGRSAVDRSFLTGEPVPVDVGPGDEVEGAAINTSGRLVVRATKVGAETALAQIARLVEQAQAGKAPVQRLADRVASVFVPLVIAVALLTFAGWLLAGAGFGAAFTAGIAVLIIACPCALGLATPTALMVGTGRGAQLGIVIKGPEVLEQTRRVTTSVLDKTGTVTEGRPELSSDVPADVLRLAAAVEAASEHPIARAI